MKVAWTHTTIDRVCDIVNGGTPKSGVAEYWGGRHQWITPAEMGKRLSPYIAETQRTISESGLRDSSARLLPPHSVILSSRAPIGHLVINTVPMATNQGCKGLVPRQGLDFKYLYYYLGSIVELLNNLGSGTTFKELSGAKLKEVPIPLPPILEQQRIVAMLDEAFEAVATAKANTEENLQNARALFESHLHNVFTNSDDTHSLRRLGDVCERITVGHVGSMASKYQDSGIPFLRSQNVRPFQISLDNVVYIDGTFDAALRKSRLRPGDVAVVRTGYPGTAAVIPDSLPVANCSDLVIVRPGPTTNPHYLTLFFNSRLGKELVAGELVGAAQKHFNISAAKDVEIAFPPLTEQAAVVERMNIFRREIQSLESAYARKQAALDSLKTSLLHQAFTGNL